MRAQAARFRDAFGGADAEQRELGGAAERFAHACDLGLVLVVSAHWLMGSLSGLVHSRRGTWSERPPLAEAASDSRYAHRWHRLSDAVEAIAAHGTRSPTFAELFALNAAVSLDLTQGLDLLGVQHDLRRCAEEVLAVPRSF